MQESIIGRNKNFRICRITRLHSNGLNKKLGIPCEPTTIDALLRIRFDCRCKKDTSVTQGANDCTRRMMMTTKSYEPVNN